MDGYEDDRFENPVSQNFHCPICLKVFKDPVTCQRNQHCFCRSCITRHLTNSETCPSCKEELTLKTLTQPPRIFMSCFSELKIRCDYINRGCQRFVQLGDLKTHVKDCDFTPVLCSNEGCLAQINKRDRTHHEAELCEFRILKCHECSEIRKEMDEVKMFLSAVTDQVEEVKVNVEATTDQVEEVKMNVAATHAKVEEMKTNSNNKMNEIKKEMRDIKKELTEINTQLMTQPDQMCGIQEAQEKMMKEIERIQIDAANVNESVVIAGGFGTRKLNTVEIFRWSERSWSPLQPMKESRRGASSFVYKNRIIVTGGDIGGSYTDKMESMSSDSFVGFGQWSNVPAKLPAKLWGHSSVVYNERLIVTGGFDADKMVFSDSIHEILLTPPYAAEFLSRMSEPRIYHGVELFDDKILVVGGRKAASVKDNVASAVIYDINKNECKEMAPLPFAVSEMATVRWGDNVIVIGGADENNKALNTVVIYNVKTGKSHMLPEMKCKRKRCAAVVSQNTIVVMGGRDEQGKILNSVERFSFNSYLWEHLPPMIEARVNATAVAW